MVDRRKHSQDRRTLLTWSLAGLFIIFPIIFFLAYFENKHHEELTQPERYKDDSLSIEERAEDLLMRMTLKEKIGQMALVEKNSVEDLSDISTYSIGGLLSGGGAKPEVNTPDGWKTMVDNFTNESRRSRLEIPVLYGIDAIHGHSNVPGATIFPHFIGLGATGDERLVEEVARATASELQATGIYWSYSPTLDMPKDIRWGRVYETFSDDPALVSRLGAAYVRGLQGGTDGTDIEVLATAKHYVGAGSMRWQSSTNEDFLIDQGVTPSDEQKLRAVYLPPFRSAIEAGALSVMVGLNSWGDKKVSASKHLITDVLKNELGFKGFVVSDWYGVYEISPINFYSSIVAINAGVDMVMLPFDYKSFVRNVTWAVRLGFISEERIDDAVRRILHAKFALGLFDETRSVSDTIGNTAHRELAREAVSRSLVLLKNDEVLPIKNVDHINVAGSAANNIGRQAGAWTVEWQGIDGNNLMGATSILEGIREIAGEEVQISYAEDGNFSTDALAPLGIAVVGEKPYAEGWGDDPEPRLSDEDLLAIKNLRASSEKVVVVLVTGRPLLITEHLPNWDALVVAWLPGSEGAGVADGLFGQTTIMGSLPVPWPASIEQLPIESTGETANGTAVLFPRYFGLSI